MPAENTFRFKQFAVEQGGAGMRITTDACLFGAWAPIAEAVQLLDIGSGTGLLSLMAAQRNTEADIYALEPDPHSAKLASLNFANSPYKHRLQLLPSTLQSFAPEAGPMFDTILCNPPFFAQHDLQPKGNAANARHQNTLSATELAAGITQLLIPTGRAIVMYPPHEAAIFETEMAALGWHAAHRCTVFPRPDKSALRSYLVLKQGPQCIIESTITISDEASNYTKDFKELLAPFYLAL